jgi:hypothetical protein
MRRFATKRHAEHATPDEWCDKCRRAELEAWARKEGLIK